jgi:hypothetical protein
MKNPKDDSAFFDYEPEDTPHIAHYESGEIAVHMKDGGPIEIIGTRYFGYMPIRQYRCQLCGDEFTSMNTDQYGTKDDYRYYKKWDERFHKDEQ